MTFIVCVEHGNTSELSVGRCNLYCQFIVTRFIIARLFSLNIAFLSFSISFLFFCFNVDVKFRKMRNYCTIEITCGGHLETKTITNYFTPHHRIFFPPWFNSLGVWSWNNLFHTFLSLVDSGFIIAICCCCCFVCRF